MSVSICPHIEATLPNMRDGKLSRVDATLFTQDVFTVYRPSFSLHEFRTLMRSYGFVDSWDLDLLEAKYFYNLSQETIADEQNYVSRSTVSRRLKELRQELKRRGFKPRRRK